MVAAEMPCVYGSSFDEASEMPSTYGSYGKASDVSLLKKNYVLPRSKMLNPDLARIINSDEEIGRAHV